MTPLPIRHLLTCTYRIVDQEVERGANNTKSNQQRVSREQDQVSEELFRNGYLQQAICDHFVWQWDRVGYIRNNDEGFINSKFVVKPKKIVLR